MLFVRYMQRSIRQRAERTSMHEVFPPYRAVLGPGLAIEPRVPQNCTRT